MSNYRRNLLVNDKLSSYIADGLAFQLCGEDATGSNWIDRIGKNNFTLYNCMIGDKCVTFNGSSSYGVCVGKDYPYNTSTIEVVLSSTDLFNVEIIFMGKANSISAGTYNNTYVISNNHNLSTRWRINKSDSNTKTISLNYSIGFENKNRLVNGGSEYWSGGDTNMYIGTRNSTATFFKGNIYQIRIYNRLLSAEEILYNQNIDFNKYGITI